jgi:uncharacterized protein (TIGR00251 family)
MKRVDVLADGRVSFSVHLTPRAARETVAGWTGDGSLKVFVTSPPVDDAANSQLLKLLSKSLGVPRSDLSIESGQRSRRKRLSAPAACKNRLSSYPDI